MKTSRPEVADVAAFGRWWVGACVLNPLNCVYAAGSLGSCAGAGGAIQSACARGRPATNRSRADGVRPRPGAKHTLFQILHVLRRLDEPLAETLIASHKQLAAAARRFPHGMESVMQEAEARRVETCGVGSGYVMGGSRGDFPYLRALMQASQDGDFGVAIEHALDQYRFDAGPDRPNQAPQEFWPSTCRFRSILYSAGNRLGRDAAVYLDRIPDVNLRLFAQIELAAALAGLPELQGTQRGYRPR